MKPQCGLVPFHMVGRKGVFGREDVLGSSAQEPRVPQDPGHTRTSLSSENTRWVLHPQTGGVLVHRSWLRPFASCDGHAWKVTWGNLSDCELPECPCMDDLSS